jgi:hypothetical protein
LSVSGVSPSLVSSTSSASAPSLRRWCSM